MIARLEGNHGGFALSSTLFPHFLGRLAATIVRLQLEFAKKQAWPGFRVWKQSISALKKNTDNDPARDLHDIFQRQETPVYGDG